MGCLAWTSHKSIVNVELLFALKVWIRCPFEVQLRNMGWIKGDDVILADLFELFHTRQSTGVPSPTTRSMSCKKHMRSTTYLHQTKIAGCSSIYHALSLTFVAVELGFSNCPW
jgi:hypothetical protein